MISIRKISGERAAPLDRTCFPADVPIDPRRGVWWGAFDDDGLCAFAGAVTWRPDDCLYLSRCGVLERARGQGLQRRLIRARLRHASAMGLTGAYTYTLNDNPTSANNLIACGFRLWWPARPWGNKRAVYFYREIR